MPDYAVRLGETLLETSEALGLSQVELAERTDQPRQTVENILQDQRERSQGWRIPIHQIGHDVGRKGMKDREISRRSFTLAREGGA